MSKVRKMHIPSFVRQLRIQRAEFRTLFFTFP